MVNGQLDTVLRHVHRLADAGGADAPADGRLLERFAAGEADAFAALVRRYGPLVLGVCRRVLGHAQDAEDAFQATFLILLRRARSLDRRGPLAGWLYTVATHAALHARAARRRRQERQVADMPHAASPPEQAWADLQPVLDEELSRLPEKYRVPVVLCYLEGKTTREAAALLGWPAGTVKGRLSRARDLLRERLTRRGVTLPAGLLGAALAERATAAVPTPLVETTVRTLLQAAAGAAAAPAARLAEGVLKALFVTRVKTATLLLVATGLVTLAAGVLTRQMLAGEQTPVPVPGGGRPASKAWPAADEINEGRRLTITGRVLDADGKPVAGAQVALVGRPEPTPPHFSTEPEVASLARADAEGRYRLELSRQSWERFRSLQLLAAASGHGLGWLRPGPEPGEATVRLRRERVLRGRLITLQGEPAAGVKVHLAGMGRPVLGQGTPVLFWEPPEGLPCWPGPLTTDARGRFTLRGVPRDQPLTLQVRDEPFARQFLEIKADDEGKSGDVALALAPAQVLEGRVTHADTGKPVPKVRLYVWAGEEFGTYYGVDARADEGGRFHVNPFAGEVVRIEAYAPEGQAYLGLREQLKWPRGAVKQEVAVALPRGVLVRGRVEDDAGRPVAGAAVQYVPRELDNPHFRDDVLFTTAPSRGPVTDADGRFRLAVLPGPGHLLVRGPEGAYIPLEIGSSRVYYDWPGGSRLYPHGLAPLDLKPEAGEVERTIRLRRGVTARGQLLTPDGKPAAGSIMLSRLSPQPDWHSAPRSVELPDGRFALGGCDPGKTYPVYFLDPRNRLGATADISAKQTAAGPLRVTLAPCGEAVARFLDDAGKPLVGHRPILEIVITPGLSFVDRKALEEGKLAADTHFVANIDRLNHWELQTDAEGRVTLPALIPGATYRLLDPRGRPTREFIAESGKTTQLGDIRFGRRE